MNNDKKIRKLSLSYIKDTIVRKTKGNNENSYCTPGDGGGSSHFHDGSSNSMMESSAASLDLASTSHNTPNVSLEDQIQKMDNPEDSDSESWTQQRTANKSTSILKSLRKRFQLKSNTEPILKIKFNTKLKSPNFKMSNSSHEIFRGSHCAICPLPSRTESFESTSREERPELPRARPATPEYHQPNPTLSCNDVTVHYCDGPTLRYRDITALSRAGPILARPIRPRPVDGGPITGPILHFEGRHSRDGPILQYRYVTADEPDRANNPINNEDDLYTDTQSSVIMGVSNNNGGYETCDVEPNVNSNQPTTSLTCQLLKLSKSGWYWGPISREEAEEKLLDQPDGAFLVRDSSADRYLLSLSFRSNGKTLHTRIEHSFGLFSFYSTPEQEGFSSIVELIDNSMHFSQSGVFCYSRSRSPGYPSYPVRLTKPITRFTQVRSLQYLCRFVIRQNTTVDNISKLPLPPSIKGYLEEGHY